ncbi:MULTISPECIES: hypothetical protein [unclassified Rhodococcus (in: high G+C Gram-positive bacteria)]|uniref:hypothetical protein n=1 Tax=unclassified Rhodococcus (in: high G+C Gram-positive bacteria) TaxID=192944 RepID=UPI001639F871|nr:MULTISPECIES: hypothetical protein [unclassified Rhodococcus (in: high G+C Gram-positive bacteria)]MBC2638461.1 hypothetical protein [Rhodococcus sp. 3A]MBC2896798.1 hypothetical protein [Rhodococcus sp. 4CII]
MSADEPEQKNAGRETEIPVPDDEAIAEAKKKMEEIDARYEPGARETVVLPGSDGTVSGTAFDDYVDDEGNLKKPEPEKGS